MWFSHAELSSPGRTTAEAILTDMHDSSDDTLETSEPTSPAGWYPDPWAAGRHRYWNGRSWTADVLVSSPPEWAAQPPPAAPAWAGQPATGWGGQSAQGLGGQPAPGWGGPDQGWGSRPDQTAPLAQQQASPYAQEAAPPASPVRWVALLAGMIAMAVLGALIVIATRSPRKSTTPAAASGPLQTVPSVPGGTTPGNGSAGGPSGPSASTDPDQTILNQLVARQADVVAPNVVGLISGGDQVAGQTTLDLCNGTFASEALRTARRQVAVADDQGSVSFSTEAVLYQNPDAAAQAFAELKATAAKCPSTDVPSPVGEPTVKTTFNPVPDGSWPQTATVDRLAYDFVSTDQQGQTHRAIAVYLRRGRVLMGLYFQQPDSPQPSVRGQTTFAGIVTVFADRLAQIPPAVANRTYTPAKSA
jgi:hypothetical protein